MSTEIANLRIDLRMDNVAASVRDLSRVQAALTRTSVAAHAAAGSIDDLGDKLTVSGRAASRAAAEYQLLARSVDRLRLPVTRASQGVAQLTRETDRATRATDAFGRSTDRARQLVEDYRSSQRGLITTTGQLTRATDRGVQSGRRLNTQLDNTAQSAQQASHGLDDAATSSHRFARGAKEASEHGRTLAVLMRSGRWVAGAVGIGGAAQAMVALASASVAAADSLKPMMAGVVAVPAAYTAAAQAAGVWKLATFNLSNALKANEKQLKFYNPAMRRFVGEIKALQPQLDKLRASAERNLFPGLTDGLVSASKNLPVVQRLVRQTAGVMSDLAKAGGAQLGNEWWARDISIVGRRNVGYLRDAGQAAFHVANALRQVTVAAKPVTDFAANGALLLSRRLEDWARLNRQNGGLRVMFEGAVTSAKQWIGIAQDVRTGLQAISRAGESLSGGLVGSLSEAADHMARWTTSLHGQSVLRDYFAQAQPVILESSRLVRDLFLELAKLGTGDDLRGLIHTVRVDLMPQIVSLLAKMQSGFGPALVDSLTNIARLLENLNGPIQTVVEGVSSVVNAINDIVKASPLLRTILGTVIGIGVAMKVINFAGAITGAQTLFGWLSRARTAAAGIGAASAGGAAAGAAAGAAGGAAAGAAGARAGAGGMLGRTIVGGNTGRVGQSLPPTPTFYPARTAPADSFNPRANQSTGFGRGVNRALGSSMVKGIGVTAILTMFADSIIKAIETDGSFAARMRAGNRAMADKFTLGIAPAIRDNLNRDLRKDLDEALQVVPIIGSMAGSKGIDLFGVNVANSLGDSVKRGMQQASLKTKIKEGWESIQPQLQSLLRPEAFKGGMFGRFNNTFKPLIDQMAALPRAARQHMAAMVLQTTAQAERLGQIPKGSTEKLRRLIEGTFLNIKVASVEHMRDMVGGVGRQLDRLRNIRLGIKWAKDVSLDGDMTRREIDHMVLQLKRLPVEYRKQTALAIMGQTAVLVQNGKLPVAAFHEVQERLVHEGIVGRRRTVAQAAAMGQEQAREVKKGGDKAKGHAKDTREGVTSEARRTKRNVIDLFGDFSRGMDSLTKDGGRKAKDHQRDTKSKVVKSTQNMRDGSISALVDLSGALDSSLKKLGAPALKFAASALGKVGTGGGDTQLFATGGYITKPTAIVGEEAPHHPEYVIATNPAYRKRNMGLFAAAGRDLGIPGFAQGGVLGFSQIANLWTQQGGNPSMANLMAAIALAESSGNAGVVNSIGATGLYQVRPAPVHPWITQAQAQDPVLNTRAAIRILREEGLRAWEVYTNGMYRQFMNGAMPDGALLGGGQGPMPVFEKLARMIVSGPAGQLKSVAQGVLDKARDAANSYGQKQVPQISGGGGIPAGAPRTGTWGMARKLAAMFGLSITSSYRSPAENVAAGGVQNSMHTHGSPSNPGAFDFVPPSSAAAAYAQSQLHAAQVLIHDAGSGLHLHVGFFKRGGKVDGPTAAVLGESGPEYVIPTNPAHRSRALGLLGQAAGALGLKKGGKIPAFGSSLGDRMRINALDIARAEGTKDPHDDLAAQRRHLNLLLAQGRTIDKQIRQARDKLAGKDLSDKDRGKWNSRLRGLFETRTQVLSDTTGARQAVNEARLRVRALADKPTPGITYDPYIPSGRTSPADLLARADLALAKAEGTKGTKDDIRANFGRFLALTAQKNQMVARLRADQRKLSRGGLTRTQASKIQARIRDRIGEIAQVTRDITGTMQANKDLIAGGAGDAGAGVVPEPPTTMDRLQARAAQAALTPGTGDDRAAAQALLAEQTKRYQLAVLSKDPRNISQAAQDLKSAQDSLAGFTPTKLDFLNAGIAKATLTPGAKDDVAAVQALVDYQRGQYNAAVKGGDPREVSQAAQDLKGAMDQLAGIVGENTQSVQEQNEFLKTALANAQASLRVSQSEYATLQKAIADVANREIGGAIGLGFMTPGFAGTKGLARY